MTRWLLGGALYLPFISSCHHLGWCTSHASLGSSGVLGSRWLHRVLVRASVLCGAVENCSTLAQGLMGTVDEGARGALQGMMQHADSLRRKASLGE